MRKVQRTASWFLALACLVILTCMAQRAAGFELLQKHAVTTQSESYASQNANDEPPVKPCELSAKSLLNAPTVIAEALVFGLMLFMALRVFTPGRTLPLFFVIPLSPSRLRIHLRLCNFRE